MIENKMSDNTNLGKVLGIIGVILIGLFLVIATRNFFSNDQVTGNIVQNVNADDNKNSQIVKLTLKDYNYFPNILNFKKGEPAKIIVDTNKVKGCFAGIIIPDLGIKKFVIDNDNIIEFTPTKTGTFKFSCPMGMGSGKIIVS